MKQFIQIHRSRIMILALTVLVTTMTASAQQTFDDPLTSVKKVEIAETFNRIEVQGNVVIVLTNHLTNSIVFRGDVNDLERATARVKKGKLIINASKNYYPGKFIVYLPAGSINSLATSGSTQILSSGTVKVSDLEILLYGSSQVSIRHQGNLRITPGTGYELIDALK